MRPGTPTSPSMRSLGLELEEATSKPNLTFKPTKLTLNHSINAPRYSADAVALRALGGGGAGGGGAAPHAGAAPPGRPSISGGGFGSAGGGMGGMGAGGPAGARRSLDMGALRGLRALLVEDNLINQTVARKVRAVCMTTVESHCHLAPAGQHVEIRAGQIVSYGGPRFYCVFCVLEML